MKLLKYLFLIVVVGFGLFVGWMNVTPGHFHETSRCCGPVEYKIDTLPEGPYCLRICPPNNLKDNLLLILSGLDFYK